MISEDFIIHFKKLLQCNSELDITTKLEDLDEWDSLTQIATAYYIKNHFNIEITPEQIKEFNTIGDIYRICN